MRAELSELVPRLDKQSENGARCTPRATIRVVRLVDAQYDNGLLRPAEPLGLRPGECVKLIVMRQPDPTRWDLARLRRPGMRRTFLSLSKASLSGPVR